MKKIAIIGSGDLGAQIVHYSVHDGHYEPVGFFDDYELMGKIKHGYPVLGKVCDIDHVFEKRAFDVLMIGIGYKHFDVRKQLFDSLSKRIPFGKIVHSSSFVDPTCEIAPGVLVYPNCTLDMHVKINSNATINAGCVIAHDTIVGAHSFLAPGVKLAGFVEVGEAVNLGIGTIVIDNRKVANNIRTGAGAVVTQDLFNPGLYVGIPAKFKKHHDSIQ